MQLRTEIWVTERKIKPESLFFSGGLAAKVQRKDTLSLRNMLDAPPIKDDIPDQTPEERREKMEQISLKLER